jgi:phenylacetate-CoA ligase
MYEFLFKKALFPAYETFVRHRSTAAHISEYDRQQWLGWSEIEAVQLGKLNALLEHCWQTVPFLKRHWSEHGVRRGALRRVEELACYPTLTKSQIKANYVDMISSVWRGRTLTKTTGGSTGDPFRFEYTMEVYARRTAVMWRGYGWAGAGLGTRTAYLWGSGTPKSGWPGLKDRLYHVAFNRRFFDAFSLSESTIDQRIEDLARYRPKAVVGYVTPVVLVARRMLDRGIKVDGIRGVLTGAEALFEPERRDIERAFGCAAFNTYGARETMLMAAECERHEGLHVNADHLVLETVDAGGKSVPPGTSGDIVITDLHNYGMPMVRYVNGDRATYSSSFCTCRRGLPLLSSIDGRILDLIETPDGRHVPGEFFVYTMLEWPDVRQWQVVQTAVDRVQFRLVVPTPWTQERRDSLTARVRTKVGAKMVIEIVEVDIIPPTPSGKRRLTISLANAAMAG